MHASSSNSLSLHRETSGDSREALRHVTTLAVNVAPCTHVAVYASGASGWQRLEHAKATNAGACPLPEQLPPLDPLLIHTAAHDDVVVEDDAAATWGGRSGLAHGLPARVHWCGVRLGNGAAPVGLLCAVLRPDLSASDVQRVRGTLASLAPIAASLLGHPVRDTRPPVRPPSPPQAPLAVVEWDVNFQVTDWSPAAEELFGYTTAEAVGMHGLDLVVDADRKRVQRDWSTWLLTPHGGSSTRTRSRTRDGHVLTCEWYNTPLVDASGTVTSVISIARDVTTEDAAAMRLAHEQRVLADVFDHVPVMMLLDDPDTGSLRVNDAFRVWMGCGQVWSPADPSDARRIDPDSVRSLRTFLDHLPEAWLDQHVTTDDGRTLETAWMRVTLPNATVLGIGIDLTEQKRREDELRLAKEEAETMNRLKTAFLANMSHEIRTPLTSILGFAEAISTDVYDDGGRRQAVRFAHLIRRSGRRLLSTLNAVLDLARLEADTMRLQQRPLSLPEAVEATIDTCRAEAETAQVALSLVVKDPSASARLDPTGVDRILSNLLDNAIKFTAPGGRVDVIVGGDATTVRIDVVDTGIGISESFQQRLFEPFEQESTGTGRHFEGTGLGLTVTRRLVELMDGTIGLDSTKGVGTRVRVIFPRLKDEAS